jgi:3-phenylpropionate/cinnamic acid dioxygenase small subunit
MLETHTPTPATMADSIELIWREASLLDAKQYDQWLGLWDKSGMYIVPVDTSAEHFEDTVNFVYDDHEMRTKRVERMMAAQAPSVADSARTVRSVSRFALLAQVADGNVKRTSVRAAQVLIAYKRGVTTIFAADVTYTLQFSNGVGQILEKIVRLVDSTDALNSIGFFL